MHIGARHVSLLDRIEQFSRRTGSRDERVDRVPLLGIVELRIQREDRGRRGGVIKGRQRANGRASQCDIIQRGPQRRSRLRIAALHQQIEGLHPLLDRLLGISQHGPHARQNPLVPKRHGQLIGLLTHRRIVALEQFFVGRRPRGRLRHVDSPFQRQPHLVEQHLLSRHVCRRCQPLDRSVDRFVGRRRATDNETRHLLDLRSLRQRNSLRRIGHDERFNSVPHDERQIVILRVLTVSQQGFSQLPALFERQPLQGRREREPHHRSRVVVRQFQHLLQERGRDHSVLQFKLNGPAGHERVDHLERLLCFGSRGFGSRFLFVAARWPSRSFDDGPQVRQPILFRDRPNGMQRPQEP